MEIISVYITAKKKFQSIKLSTVYQLDISCLDKTWTIFKSYKNFAELDLKLRNKYLKTTNQIFPILPFQKKSNLYYDKIAMLQDYFDSLISIPGIIKSEEFQNFLEMSGSDRVMLITKLKSKDGQEFEKSSYNESDIVDTFLMSLKDSSNRQKIIKKFEINFFNVQPNLDSFTIRKLFKGFNNANGLLYHAGNFGFSFIVACSALNLLYDIVNIEKNKYALSFLNALCSLSTAELTEMNLKDHILSQRGSKITAFNLVLLISHHVKNLFDSCIQDEWAKQEYTKWKNFLTNKQETDRHSKKKSDIVNLKSIEPVQYSKKLEAEMLKVFYELESNSLNWKKFDEKFNLMHSYNKESKLMRLKFEVDIKCSAEKVFGVISNFEKWNNWCLKYKTGKILERVSDVDCVASCSLTSFLSPYKYQNLVLFIRKTKLESNNFLVCFHSIECDSVNLNLKHKKGTFLTSGFYIEDLKSSRGECRLKGHFCFKDNCIMMFSSDILKESSELVISIANLKKVCEEME